MVPWPTNYRHMVLQPSALWQKMSEELHVASMYLFQGANCMPGELCDGSAHLSVLVSITRYKVHLKRVIVSSSYARRNQTCCSEVT